MRLYRVCPLGQLLVNSRLMAPAEVLRWHNVAPLGVPHRAVEDGVVNGYFVPKGAIIVANLWYQHLSFSDFLLDLTVCL